MRHSRNAAFVLGSTLLALTGLDPAYATLPPAPVLGHAPEYVIVTSQSLAPEFERLARGKSRLGVPAMVQTIEGIQLAYPGGRDDAERVRLFLQDARATWNPRYVLLGGDATVVPVRQARTQFYGGWLLPTDLYYAALDGDWNADEDALWGEGYQSQLDPGDLADLTADVFVGRAPVRTPAEAHVFVDKATQASLPPPGPRAHGVLLAAEMANGLPGLPPEDGAELAESLRAHLADNPDVHVARLYESWADPRWVGSWPLTRASLVDSLNAGYDFAVHVGGGGLGSLGLDPPLLANADATSIAPGRATVFCSLADGFGAIDAEGLGRALMLVPGGVHAVLGSSSRPASAGPAGALEELARLVYDEGVTALGEAAARQVQPLVPYSAFDGVNRWTVMTSTLLGDPEMRLYVRAGTALVVTAPGVLNVGATGFGVDVAAGGLGVANARVSAWIDDEQLVIGTTDALGHATVPLEVAHAGTCELTVTTARGERRALSIPMLEPVGADRPMAADRLSLEAPTPNPARVALRLGIGIAADVRGRVWLEAYDLSGRLVRRLHAAPATPGRFDITWDLRADDGAVVPGGLYFVRLRGEPGEVVRRVSVMP